MKRRLYLVLFVVGASLFLSILGVWHDGKFSISQAWACCADFNFNSGFLTSDCPPDQNGINGNPIVFPTCTLVSPPCQNTDCSQSVDGVVPCAPCTATAQPTATEIPTATAVPTTAVPTATTVPTSPPTPTACPTIDQSACNSCTDVYDNNIATDVENFQLCLEDVLVACPGACVVVLPAYPECETLCLTLGGVSCGLLSAQAEAIDLAGYLECQNNAKCSGC